MFYKHQNLHPCGCFPYYRAQFFIEMISLESLDGIVVTCSPIINSFYLIMYFVWKKIQHGVHQTQQKSNASVEFWRRAFDKVHGALKASICICHVEQCYSQVALDYNQRHSPELEPVHSGQSAVQKLLPITLEISVVANCCLFQRQSYLFFVPVEHPRIASYSW